MGAADRSAASDALMTLSRTMTALVARTLGSVHDTVTIPQLRVMVMISNRGPLNLTAVADGLGVNPSSASRTCDKLVGAGLLLRGDREDDRRNIVLSLSERGTHLVSSLMAERRVILDAAVARMSVHDQQQLVSALNAFSSALATAPDGEDSTSAGWVEWLM